MGNLTILVNAILKCELSFYDDPDGAFEYTCPLCHEKFEDLFGKINITMDNFPHKNSCVYILSKEIQRSMHEQK